MTSAIDENAVTCIVSEWSILIGYTMALCPILIKVHTINKISHQSSRFRRLQIDGSKLTKYPAYVLLPVSLFLIVWTGVDRPLRLESLALDEKQHGVSDTVCVTSYCSSSSIVWALFSNLWQLVLLFLATVLAFQAGRHTNGEMNEKQLGLLVYSLFLCLVLRLVVVILTSNGGTIPVSHRSQLISIMLSIDVISSMGIYLGPKLYSCLFGESTSALSSRGSTLSQASSIHSRRSSMVVRRNSIFSGKNANESMELKQDTTKAIMKCMGVEVSEYEEEGRRLSGVMNLRKRRISVIKPRDEVLEMLK